MTEYSPVHWLTFAMVAIWGVRLSLHIGRRHKGEDYRYVKMRERWTKCEPFSWFACYLNVYFLQGLFSMVVNASAIHVIRYADVNAKIGGREAAGAVVWIIGFLCEVI